MPKGDEGLDISRSEGADDISIVPYFFFIPSFFFGLDARPLDGEAMRRMTEGGGKIEVFFVAMVMVAGDSRPVIFGVCGFLAEFFRPTREVSEFRRCFLGEAFGVRPLPLRPIVCRAAFHLVRRGRRSPEEPFWENSLHIDKILEIEYTALMLTGTVPV